MIELIRESKDGSKKYKFGKCEFSVNIFNKVLWSNDWPKIFEMTKNGLFSEEHGPMNHTDQILL